MPSFASAPVLRPHCSKTQHATTQRSPACATHPCRRRGARAASRPPVPRRGDQPRGRPRGAPHVSRRVWPSVCGLPNPSTPQRTRLLSRIRSARAHRNRAHGRGAAALTSPRGLDRDSVSQPASGRDPVPVLHPHRRPVTYRASPSPGRKLALTTRQSTVTVATVAAFRARRVVSLSLW